MVREYGTPPYKLAVVHGGPGALGSLGEVAQRLSEYMGVLEPIQSKHDIEGMISELDGQLSRFGEEPVFLLGHSWGAWLCTLYAAQHPQKVKGLLLVGSGPWEDRYVPLIMQRRLQRLTQTERAEFETILRELEDGGTGDKNQQMARLGALVEKADNVDVLTKREVEDMELDGEMYAQVWPQAAAMRRDGRLLQSLARVRCPVCILHGRYDPHPIEGVVEPMERQGVHLETHLMEQCGHAPFQERHAREEFYRLVLEFLSRQSQGENE